MIRATPKTMCLLIPRKTIEQAFNYLAAKMRTEGSRDLERRQRATENKSLLLADAHRHVLITLVQRGRSALDARERSARSRNRAFNDSSDGIYHSAENNDRARLVHRVITLAFLQAAGARV